MDIATGQSFSLELEQQVIASEEAIIQSFRRKALAILPNSGLTSFQIRGQVMVLRSGTEDLTSLEEALLNMLEDLFLLEDTAPIII